MDYATIIFCLFKHKNKERRIIKMGIFFGWFQCNDVKELEAKKEKLLEEVKAIDEKIKELKG